MRPRRFVKLTGGQWINLAQVVRVVPVNGYFRSDTGESLTPPCYRVSLSNGVNLVVGGDDTRRVLLGARRL